jgi:hypothetical protein
MVYLCDFNANSCGIMINMKGLFLGGDDEDFELVSNLIKTYFNKISLSRSTSHDEALGLISYDGPFGFFIFYLKGNQFEPSKTLPALIDFTGNRPSLFIGSPTSIQTFVNDETLNLHEKNKVLYEPIVIEDFRLWISDALTWVKDQEYEESIIEVNKSDYIPMKIKNFYYSKESQFDVYMEYTPTQFIKIISKNKPYTFSFLDSFAKKGVRQLYLFKDDHLKFLEQQLKKCENKLNTLQTHGNEILNVQMEAIDLAHSYIKSVGVTETIIKFLDHYINSIHATFDINLDLVSILDKIPTNNPGISCQTLMVTYTMEAFLEKFGWNSEITRRKCIFAILMSDLFASESHYKMLEFPQDESQWSNEIKSYATHSTRAAEISRRFTLFPDVDFLIEQHHELPNGKGFPHGIASIKITTLSALIILATNFCTKLEGKPITYETIKEIVQELSEIMRIGNFREPFAKLKKILNIN